MRSKVLSAFLPILLFGISQGVYARLTRHWTYQEMFDKSDLVVIATVDSSKDNTEHTTLPDYSPPLSVIGVITVFESSLIFKGPKGLKEFQLHHYRYQNPADEAAVANTPDLIKIRPGQQATFLLFLAKEADGSYVPVTGQTDPATLSVLNVRGVAD